jgi:hypothetical protein
MNITNTSLSIQVHSSTGYSLTQSPAALRSEYKEVWPKQFPTGFGFAHLASVSLESRMREIASLRDGWHGEGSFAISEAIVHRVRNLLPVVARLGMPSPEITPHANGTISLEWENSKICIFVEFGKTRIGGFVQTGSDRISVLPESADISDAILERWASILTPPPHWSLSFGTMSNFGAQALSDSSLPSFSFNRGAQPSGTLQLPAA